MPLNLKAAPGLEEVVSRLVQDQSVQSVTLRALAPQTSQHDIKEALKPRQTQLAKGVKAAAGPACKLVVVAKEHNMDVTICIKVSLACKSCMCSLHHPWFMGVIILDRTS